MMRQVVAGLFLLIFHVLMLPAGVSAQDDCGLTTDKKAQSLFEKSQNRKKYERDERVGFLKEAMEIDPDFAVARWEYTVGLIRSLKYNGSSLKSAEEHLLSIIEVCPDIHSDPYYYLGTIALDAGRYQDALDYYKQFMQFQSEDEKKFSRDFDDKYQHAKEERLYAKFYLEYYVNPKPFDPRLVLNISTKLDEYLPYISPDNSKLLFTQRYIHKPKVKHTSVESDAPVYIENFLSGDRQPDGQFKAGVPLPTPFNADPSVNYGGASLSLDNRHLFVTLCKMKNGYQNCDIYSSDYVLGNNPNTGVNEWHWTELQNLGPNVNTDFGWESQPSLSADGKTLYFTAAREENKETGMDIYFTQKMPDGTWGPSERMGEPINTPYGDKTPFMHSDSETLYFASNGHMGFGGYDVFFTKRVEGKWLEPKNLGYPINTEKDEHGFVVSTDGKLVYFSSDKGKAAGTGMDIYSFELYKEARPEKVLFLTGNLITESGESVKNAKLEIKNTKTNEIQEIEVDSTNGAYAAVVTLKEDEDVVVEVKKQNEEVPVTMPPSTKPSQVKQEEKEEDIAFNAKVFNLSDTTSGTFVDMDVKVETLEENKPFKIEDIYYGTNSAELTTKSISLLKSFAAYLEERPSVKFEIHGHTDNVGSESDNLALSADRAYSVMERLAEEGIETERMAFKGFGETQPVASNDTEEGRALNRRTEFVVIAK